MANPRQRRKLRSSSHKPVHHSKRAKKNLKKQPPIRGPKELQEAWDKTKTVRQNYEALGLVSSLTPTASGGVERRVLGVEKETSDSMEVEPTPEGSTKNDSATAGPSGLRKGFGRIVRDESGNVVDIQLDEDETTGGAAADRLVEDAILDPSQQDRLSGWVNLGSSSVPRDGSIASTSTHVVQRLEESSKARGGRVPRFSSNGELGVLRRLVEKYGQDVEGMGRDRKLNADQRTAGQLKRAIQKAGGFAQVLLEG
ncbi:ribosome biogenesis protein Nop16 [Cytidiella melzeri]|nr:ribosome biogenesis protein Nop16 [Cytidiella melzeri]